MASYEEGVSMGDIKPVAKNLEEASILLDGHKVLAPGTPDYEQFYIERPQVESNLIREVMRAEQADRPFQLDPRHGKSVRAYG